MGASIIQVCGCEKYTRAWVRGWVRCVDACVRAYLIEWPRGGGFPQLPSASISPVDHPLGSPSLIAIFGIPSCLSLMPRMAYRWLTEDTGSLVVKVT
jgi:hypothetical protein